MNWKHNFDLVINELKLHESHKSDSHYFIIQDKVQFLHLSIKDYICIPPSAPYIYNSLNIGETYIINTHGWEYTYKYLNKFSSESVLLYPKEVIYDYIMSYRNFVDIIKDKGDYLELYNGTYLLYDLYQKWLRFENTDYGIIGGCLYRESNYYHRVLTDNLRLLYNNIIISEYNNEIINEIKYLMIKSKLPEFINIIILQYLLIY